jgi:calcineurin-like phosphoesterase family protein
MTQKIWFTSDNHFYHKNILKFQAEAGTRFGNDANEMNELMISKWNSQVALADKVYCLGDFSFGKPELTEAILKRLNGQLNLIRGNHEHWLTQETEQYFEDIRDYREITIDGIKIVLFHFPIEEWNRMHHGAFHLFGHVHGHHGTKEGRSMDVGIDARPQKDMGLWSWEEIKETLKDKPILSHNGGYRE